MLPLAIEVPVEAIMTAGFLSAAFFVGAGKFLLEHRELKKNTARQSSSQTVIAEKDARIAELQKTIEDLRRSFSYRELLDARDEQIEGLSKALSKKSDEHAEKVQELLELTLEKSEAAAAKNVTLVERMLDKVSTFTDEVRKLSAALGQRGG